MKYKEIGEWSEVKLDIISDYGRAYSTIMSVPERNYLHHVYIDAFAGSGTHISRSSGGFVSGSPVNALNVEPPFEEYFFIDNDAETISVLRGQVGERHNVYIYEGDSNLVLLDIIYPQVRYEDYRRALCLLDPYGLDLKWDQISGMPSQRAAREKGRPRVLQGF